jgi:hypothetical protein
MSYCQVGQPVSGDHPALAQRTEEFIPFLDYNLEIRKVLCSTNAIESLNARYRRAVKARGHFPTEQAAMKMPLPGHPIPRLAGTGQTTCISLTCERMPLQ